MKKKFNIGRFLRGLSFAVLITSLLSLCVVGVFARYKSEISGTATMRVAKWDVKMESTSTTMNFDGSGCSASSEILTYDFTVTSNSEVAVGYVVNVSFDKPLPQNVRLWLDNASDAIICDGTKTEFTFSGYAYNIGDAAKNHSLCIEVTYMQGEQVISFEHFESAVDISVTAEQKMLTQ